MKDLGIPFGFEDDERYLFEKHGVPWPPNVRPWSSVPLEERARAEALNRDLYEHRRKKEETEGVNYSIPPWERPK